MNRELFLRQLGRKLAQLPPDEIHKHLDYYNEIIEDMMEDGISEEKAVESFGNIDNIAMRTMQDVPITALVKYGMKPKKGWTPAAIAIAVIGSPLWIPLVAAAAAVIAAIYISIWAVIASVFASVVSVGISGGYLLFTAFTMTSYGAGYVLVTLGIGLVLLGFCLLGFLVGKIVTVKLICLTKWLWRKTKSLFIKKPAVNMGMGAA